MRDSRALALTRFHYLPLEGQPAARKASCPRPWPQEEVHPSARSWGSRRKTRVRSRCHSPRTRRPPALHCSSLGPWQAACVFHLTLRWPTQTKGQSGLRLHERFENKEVTSSPTVPETRYQGKNCSQSHAGNHVSVNSPMTSGRHPARPLYLPSHSSLH